MTVAKRAEYQKKSAAKAKKTGENRDQLALDMVMNDDPEMAELYQEAFA